jgi:hypothetical protein
MNCLLADTYYNYQHNELSKHSAIRRFAPTKGGGSGVSEDLHPTAQVTETVQINGSSTTSAPPDGGSLTSKGSYVTRERNVTGVNLQDVNRTSWPTTTNSSKPHINFTVVNATVPLKNSTIGMLRASLYKFPFIVLFMTYPLQLFGLILSNCVLL